MNFGTILGFALTVAAFAVGCNPVHIGETVAEAEKQEAEREQCKRLATNHLVETTDLEFYDEGIINDYRQLSAVTVINRAKHCTVLGGNGMVFWSDGPASTFAFGKSIPASSTERLSTTDRSLVRSTTTKSSARQAMIVFTSIDAIYTP